MEIFLKELFTLAESFVYYNQFSYGHLFSNIKEEKIEQLQYETYTNFCKETADLGQEGEILFQKTQDFFIKLSLKFDDLSEQNFDKLAIPNCKKSMYTLFLYIYNCLDILKNNLFILFLKSVPKMDFEDILDNPDLIESLQFIQKCLTIAWGVIDIHKKRRTVTKRRKYF